jgi:hypothetical protein
MIDVSFHRDVSFKVSCSVCTFVILPVMFLMEFISSYSSKQFIQDLSTTRPL